MVPRTEATRVFLAHWRVSFQSRFRPDRGKSWWFESSMLCLNMSSFQRTRARRSNRCESERIFAQAQQRRGGNYEIFNTCLFHPSVFARTVDVVPNVGFRWSWCRWRACVAYFSKVRALHKGELGFARYGPTSRGRWNVLHVGGSFSDRDSDLTGEALDDPRVAHCSWSDPLT